MPPQSQRIQKIKKIQQEQAAASQFDAKDRQALLQWIDRYAQQHEARLLEMLPPFRRQQFSKLRPEVRHRMVLALIYQQWQRVGAASLAVSGSGELAALRGGLSPQTRGTAGSASRHRPIADRGRVDRPGVAAASGGPASCRPAAAQPGRAIGPFL